MVTSQTVFRRDVAKWSGPRATLSAVLLAGLVGMVLGVSIFALFSDAPERVDAPGSADPPDAAVAGEQRSRADIGDLVADERAASVVRVEAGGCGEVRQASATIVHAAVGDLIVTNAHVIRGSGTVTLHSSDGDVVAAEVLGALDGRDAALLRVSDGDGESIGAPSGAGARVGDEVVVVGYPGGERVVARGQIVATEVRSGYGGSARVMLIDVQAEAGVSGGAVLDATGRVVGLVAARDPDTGSTVAYPIDELLARSLGPIPSC